MYVLQLLSVFLNVNLLTDDFRSQRVSLQAVQLLAIQTGDEMQDRLERFPHDPKAAYDGIYEETEPWPEDTRVVAIRAFSWMM
jgi:hypothetical protein